MREIRVRVAVPGRDLHDWGGEYGMSDLCPVPVHRLELLADDTVAFVAAVDGDLDRVRERFLADETVIDATVTDDPEGLVHCRFEPRPVVRRMLDGTRETPLVLGTPLYLNADGSVTATFYGDERSFAETVEHMPDDSEVEIERMRGVTSPDASVFARLTDRQREVLDAAVEAGYYDDPRGATHEDLAAALGVSPATVGEHLRRIERRVFAAYRQGR